MRRADCVSPTCHCSNSGTQVGRCAAMEEAVEQLANLRRQIHNVQSRQSSCKRKSCESLLAEFSCPKRLQHRVLLVYIYSGHCSQAAEFLKRSLAASSNSHGDSLDYEAAVENLYIEAPLQVIVDLETEPMSCAQACDVIVAMEFALQRRLRSWVEHLNTDRGVTPSRAMMIAYAMDNISSAVPVEFQELLLKRLGGPARAQRKWLARFRRRWQCRIGRLPVQDVVPFNLQQKASRWHFM